MNNNWSVMANLIPVRKAMSGPFAFSTGKVFQKIAKMTEGIYVQD